MSLRRKCATCGKKLTAGEVAAEVWTPTDRSWWCMECWDAPDDVALHQYQHAQASPSIIAVFDAMRPDPTEGGRVSDPCRKRGQVPVMIRMPPELHEAIKAKAAAEERSMAGAIRHALREWAKS